MFKFPTAPRPQDSKFTRNTLKSALFQIKFPPASQITGSKEFLLSSLERSFPRCLEIAESQFAVSMSGEASPPPTRTTVGFEFRSEDAQRTVAIKNDSLTLTILGEAYTNHQDALQIFLGELLPLLLTLKIKEFSRVATRKINVLESSPLGRAPALESVFSSDIVESLTAVPPFSLLHSVLNRLVFRSDDYTLAVHYGLMPVPETSSKQIILDLDLFLERPGIVCTNIHDEFLKINTELFNAFGWFMSKATLEALNSERKQKV